MDRFQPGGPPAVPPGGAPQTFAAYLGQRNPQLLQAIGGALGGGQGGPPMGGPPGMGAPGMMGPGGPPPMMGGGMTMPPEAQALATQDPMYRAGQAAARMLAGRGLPGAGGPPMGGGMPPMGGPPGIPPR